MSEIFTKGYTVIDSGIPGPSLAIMGSIHGNEACGAETLLWLENSFLKNHPLEKGKVKLILGNPKALQAQQRYIHFDLNRLFGELPERAVSLDKCYERQRVEEIKLLLKDCELLLDIHSTRSPTPAMSISNQSPTHLQWCNTLTVDFVTTGFFKPEVELAGMVACEYIDSIGGIGITVECGQNEAAETRVVAQQSCIRTLNHFGFISVNIPPRAAALHVEIMSVHKVESESFQFLLPPEHIKNFSKLSKDTPIAQDGETTINAPFDCFLIMPDPQSKHGEEAFYIGITRELH